MDDLELKARAEEYTRERGLELTDCLGGGTDGSVWKTNRKTAAKAFQYQKNFLMERDCYQRLKEHNVTKIRQLAVPRLIGWDDPLHVIEMELVTPPYLIDFGKAYLDYQPDHSRETWADHYERQREIWEDKIKEVEAVLWELRELGIYYRDAKPGNIMF